MGGGQGVTPATRSPPRWLTRSLPSHYCSCETHAPVRGMQKESQSCVLCFLFLLFCMLLRCVCLANSTFPCGFWSGATLCVAQPELSTALASLGRIRHDSD